MSYKNAIFKWLLGLALALGCFSAGAATFIHFEGPARTYTAADGPISLVKNYRNGIQVTLNGSSTSLQMNFGPPQGDVFSLRTYLNAERFWYASPTHPAMEVTGTGITGCAIINGRFDLLELVYAPDGSVSRFALDFEQRCAGTTIVLTGVIRFNSDIPQVSPTPVAYAGIAQLADEGGTVTLDGSGSRDPGGSSLTYSWSQTGGPAVALSGATSASPSFTAPQVAAGGVDLTFQLRVTNGAGVSATSSSQVHVLDASDPRTFLYLDSDPNDYIGQGQVRRLTPSDGMFVVDNYFSGVTVSFNGGTPSWSLSFYAPSGQSLAPGTYSAAQRFSSNVRPGLAVFGESRSCNASVGTFIIREYATRQDGRLERFAADFVQHCEGGAAALYGAIRYNSAVPFDQQAPIASAGLTQSVDEGTLVLLDGSGSGDPNGSPLTYAWSQTAGPAVTLTGASSATASFTAPLVAAGGADLAFELRVTNGVGRSATSNVSVHVMDPTDPHTVFFTSDNPTRHFTPSDGKFTASMNYRGGVSLSFDGAGNWWYLDFGPATGQPFVPGAYVNAERYAFAAPTRPGLDVSGNGFGCNTLTGAFYVYEVVLGAGGVVQKFAADFEQYCSGSTTPLRGSIRFNSAVPLVPDTPLAAPVGPRYADEGQNVALDGSRSFNAAGGTLTYAWTQLAGPTVTLTNANSASPSFTAPSVAPGGADVTFELRVTNAAGLSSTANVTTHVMDAADPRTFIYFDSDPGDYIGAGVMRSFSADDGTIGAGTNYRGGVTVSFNGGLNWWTLEFGPPSGQSFAPGTYALAERFAFASPMRPGLDVSGSGRGCNTLTGQFTVLEIEVVNGVVKKFAADFVQHCEGGTAALYGAVRFNSSIRYVPTPVASPGPPRTVDEGDVVRLDGSASGDPAGGGLTYLWTQISGPAVVLSDASAVKPTFTAPAVPPGGATLVFRLTVTDSAGVSSTADVSITVLDAADPHTFLWMDSDSGDYIGGGIQQRLTPSDGGFTATKNYRNGVTIDFRGGLNWLTLEFGPPVGQQFLPGTYTMAERFPFAQSSRPGLNVYGNGAGCNTLTGEFTVLEVAFTPDNKVERFAADFVQHCEGFTPALYGSIRFNSAVPLSSVRPRVALTSTASSIAFGASISFTANVTGVTSIPSGTVAFRLGGNVIPTCSAVALSGGSATCTTTSLPPGTRNVTAVYSGNGTYASATSAASSVTVSALAAPNGTNWSLASNGATASASSTQGSAYDVASVINNVRSGMGWGTGAGGWRDSTANVFPDWVEVRFDGAKEISRVVVYGLQDAAGSGVEPTDAMFANSYALRDFVVQGWNGSAWVDLAAVTGNFLVKRPVSFAAFSTDRIRVSVSNALLNVTRIVEIEAWGFSVVTPGATETPSGRNVALAGNGAAAVASSIGGTGGFPVASVIDGVRTGAGWGAGGGWKDATANAFPDWVQVNFAGARTIDRVVVYSLQDAAGAGVEPTDAMTFTSFGITSFTVEGWSGSAWIALGSVSGNNLVKRTVSFPQTTTDRIRVSITGAMGGVSRVVEIEAWEPTSGGGGGGGTPPPPRTNVALASAGSVASASSTGGAAGAFPASSLNNGDVRGLNWGAGGGWKDATPGAYPDWVQVDFGGTKTIDEVVVYSLQDSSSSPVQPTDTLTFSSFGLIAFTVEGWNGSAWTVLGTVSGNNLVKRSVSFSPFAASKVRVNITNAASGVSRMVELEAWGN